MSHFIVVCPDCRTDLTHIVETAAGADIVGWLRQYFAAEPSRRDALDNPFDGLDVECPGDCCLPHQTVIFCPGTRGRHFGTAPASGLGYLAALQN